MKSIFNSNSVTITSINQPELILAKLLQDEGFYLKRLDTTLDGCELDYPAYTNATEAKEIYRAVQNELKLKLATPKA